MVFPKHKMERRYTNVKLYHQKGMLENNNLNFNNGIFQKDSLSPFFLYCCDCSTEGENIALGYKTIIKRINQVFYMDDLKLYAKYDDV